MSTHGLAGLIALIGLVCLIAGAIGGSARALRWVALVVFAVVAWIWFKDNPDVLFGGAAGASHTP